ncbi:MAG: tetratricopeptide repeat protein [Myxococcota bacterium]|nr:tetratricopeptide repeat protein [Myxococcota bacterium]
MRILYLFLLLSIATTASSQRLSPLDTEVQRAVKAWDENKLSVARTHLQRAVELSPKDAELRYNLGVVSLAINDVNSAIDAFQAALRLNTEHVDSLYNLGRLYVNIKEYERGLLLLERASELSPNDPGPQLQVVTALVLQGRTEDAWRRARSISSKRPDVLSMLAFLAMRLEFSKEALEYAKLALQSEPSVQRHRLVLAQAHILADQFREALDALEIAKRNSEEPLANIPYLRGLVAFLELRFVDAFKEYRTAVELAPTVFGKQQESVNVLAFPLHAERVFMQAINTSGPDQIPSAFSRLNIGNGCNHADTVAFLFRANPKVSQCYRGAKLIDIDIIVRRERVIRTRIPDTTRATRCIDGVLRKIQMPSTVACSFRVRVGKSLVQ